ncbi:apolipoprotein A-II [Dendropsophus ebraccatus]|uniref:apolipoprotein A-II n=1 Tax=Dendropsophus ebraccatus TaxID=150705 RepID=UPI003831A389
MKVLALTVLILVIGSLEAGVVKREVPNADEVTKLFENFFETVKSSTQELVQKFQSGELQAQAGQLLEQTKAQADPYKTEIEKFFAKLVEAGKNLAS